MNGKAFGERIQFLGEFQKFFAANACLNRFVGILSAYSLPKVVKALLGHFAEFVVHFRVGQLHALVYALDVPVQLLLRGDPGFFQRIEINLVDRRPLLYPGVHLGLSVIRLVSLVVSVPPVANQVHYDVLCELRPVIQRQFHNVKRRLRIFAVDMKDRRHEHLGYVRGVPGGPSVLGKRGEPDLVVDDEVERPPGGIAFQLRQVEGFGHDSLARKGCIPMDQNGKHLVAAFLSKLFLSCVRQSFEHRVNRFQMARIVWDQYSQMPGVT